MTSSMIKERLHKEVENNVTLSLRPSVDSESIDVQGNMLLGNDQVKLFAHKLVVWLNPPGLIFLFVRRFFMCRGAKWSCSCLR